MKRVALIVLAFMAAGCATVVGPLQPLSGGTALQAWSQLARTAEVPGTLSTYASVRVTTPEGRRSFRAAIDADSEGTVRMRAFTPVGTEVFAFEVRHGEMVFADHGAKATWRGPFREVAGQLGIPDSLGAPEFARLVFGLPAAADGADLSRAGEGLVRQGDLEYVVTGVGLASVSKVGSSWRAGFDPPAYPAEAVSFEDDTGRSIVVRHLDLSHARATLRPLEVDASYRCCYPPTISKQ